MKRKVRNTNCELESPDFLLLNSDFCFSSDERFGLTREERGDVVAKCDDRSASNAGANVQLQEKKRLALRAL
jgi:hypothetical protein